MEIIITGKDFQLTSSLKNLVEEKAAKLQTYRKDIEYVKIELDVDKHHKRGEKFRVEGWVKAPRENIKAGERGFTMQEALDGVMEKLATQLRKDKVRKLQRRKPSRV